MRKVKRMIRRLFHRECVHICPVDGQKFIATRPEHRYCSRACKLAADAQTSAAPL
jgi:hypothetical protein